MPNLMTILVNDAKQDIDIKMESADIPSETENAGVVFKMKGFEGQQRITMNTSALESKIAAFKLFSMISDSLGSSIAPYSE